MDNLTETDWQLIRESVASQQQQLYDWFEGDQPNCDYAVIILVNRRQSQLDELLKKLVKVTDQ